jgi:hypothetical protein
MSSVFTGGTGRKKMAIKDKVLKGFAIKISDIKCADINSYINQGLVVPSYL